MEGCGYLGTTAADALTLPYRASARRAAVLSSWHEALLDRRIHIEDRKTTPSGRSTADDLCEAAADEVVRVLEAFVATRGREIRGTRGPDL